MKSVPNGSKYERKQKMAKSNTYGHCIKGVRAKTSLGHIFVYLLIQSIYIYFENLRVLQTHLNYMRENHNFIMFDVLTSIYEKKVVWPRDVFD